MLERDERFDQIEAEAEGGASGLRLKTLRRWRSPESLLLPIGEELAKFICNDDFQYVKACEGSTCTLLFVDRTRGAPGDGAAWRSAETGRSRPPTATGERPTGEPLERFGASGSGMITGSARGCGPHRRGPVTDHPGRDVPSRARSRSRPGRAPATLATGEGTFVIAEAW